MSFYLWFSWNFWFLCGDKNCRLSRHNTNSFRSQTASCSRKSNGELFMHLEQNSKNEFWLHTSLEKRANDLLSYPYFIRTIYLWYKRFTGRAYEIQKRWIILELNKKMILFIYWALFSIFICASNRSLRYPVSAVYFLNSKTVQPKMVGVLVFGGFVLQLYWICGFPRNRHFFFKNNWSIGALCTRR